jgi:hypothetical protein
MSEDADPVLEAVAALRALGHTVVPDDDFKRWHVDGGEWITLGDLLALALRLGLMDSTTTKLQ